MPVVGLVPLAGQLVDQGPLQAPAVPGLGDPPVACHRQRAHHLPEHVGLPLLDRRVADAHGPGAGVAGEVVELALGEMPATLDGVHHLHVHRIARDRPQQPVAPVLRIVGAARGEQGLQRQRGIAQPAVAVVPVALPAELLGERGRRRGDDATGVGMGQAAQGDQAAHDLTAPGTVVLTRVRPPLPLLEGVGQPGLDVHGVGDVAVRRDPGQREVESVPGLHLEGLLVVAVDRWREARPGEDQLVRPSGGDDRRTPFDLLPVHPGPDPAVVEADDPDVAQHDRAAHPLHPAYDVGSTIARRHQVDDADLAGVGGVRRLQHRAVTDVAARGGVLALGADEPVPVLVVAEQGREAGRGVELGQAEPVQRPVDADQRRGVTVADGGVVLYRARHAGRLASRPVSTVDRAVARDGASVGP